MKSMNTDVGHTDVRYMEMGHIVALVLIICLTYLLDQQVSSLPIIGL